MRPFSNNNFGQFFKADKVTMLSDDDNAKECQKILM